jgi:hypothetical protein
MDLRGCRIGASAREASNASTRLVLLTNQERNDERDERRERGQHERAEQLPAQHLAEPLLGRGRAAARCRSRRPRAWGSGSGRQAHNVDHETDFQSALTSCDECGGPAQASGHAAARSLLKGSSVSLSARDLSRSGQPSLDRAAAMTAVQSTRLLAV